MSEATARSRPSRFRRVKRWATVAAVIMVVGTPSWLIYRMGARRSAAIAAADRHDPRWRLADLLAAREPVPDAENGAIPVIEAAAKLPETYPPATNPEEADEGLSLKAAFDRATRAKGPNRLDDETLAVLRAELAARADALTVARRVVDFARGRHEATAELNFIVTRLDGVDAARRVSRLLKADAIVAAHVGRPDDAIAACRAMLGVGRTIGDAPGLMPQLFRVLLDRQAIGAVVATLAWGEPSADALARAQDDVMAALAEPIERHAFRGERASDFDLIERLKVDPNLLRPDKPIPGPFRVVWSPFLAWQQMLLLEFWNELATIPEQPTPGWLPALEDLRARRVAPKAWLVGSIDGLFATLHAPDDAPDDLQGLGSFMNRRAYLGAAAILLAAERHRRATGRWPASADAIDPDILPDPPVDPYTGEPFRFLHADGLLRIYSRGANLRDERGAYDPRRRMLPDALDDVGTYGYDPELRGRPAIDEDGRQPPGS